MIRSEYADGAHLCCAAAKIQAYGDCADSVGTNRQKRPRPSLVAAAVGANSAGMPRTKAVASGCCRRRRPAAGVQGLSGPSVSPAASGGDGTRTAAPRSRYTAHLSAGGAAPGLRQFPAILGVTKQLVVDD